MPDQKCPIHEVISRELTSLAPRVSRHPENPRGIQVITLITVLENSGMRAADAHQVAAEQAQLPQILKDLGNEDLSKRAEAMLTDLRTRTD